MNEFPVGQASCLSSTVPPRSPASSWARRPACLASAPRAFTLVELMVVIMILAMLAGLMLPILLQSITKARNAAIKAEIDMLHMAIMNYKQEYGSFPPASSSLAPGDLAAKHLGRIFPRCPKDSTVNPAINIPQQLTAALPATASPATITPTNALTYWLSGYTDDPMQPLSGSRKKLFDFDISRVNQVSGGYSPAGKPGSPYLYITSSQYVANQYTPALIASGGVGAQFVPPQSTPTPLPANQLLWFTNLNYAAPQTQAFANPDTFQILCAGRDEVFGNDDDLSNFWPGTRREYLDSLKK